MPREGNCVPNKIPSCSNSALSLEKHNFEIGHPVAASTASTTAMTSKSASTSTMKKRYLGRSLSLTGSLPTWLRGKSSQNDVGGSGGAQWS